MQTIMVAIKRVVDYNVRVRVKPDGSGMATEGLKMSINPFDEIAIEAALRLKESGTFANVVLVTIGPVEAEQQLRTGLAMGADRAMRVDAPAQREILTGERGRVGRRHGARLSRAPRSVTPSRPASAPRPRSPRGASDRRAGRSAARASYRARHARGPARPA